MRETTESGHVTTHTEANMESYCETILKRFEECMEVKVKEAKTPRLDTNAHNTFEKANTQYHLIIFLLCHKDNKVKQMDSVRHDSGHNTLYEHNLLCPILHLLSQCLS